MAVRILTDSTADILPAEAKELGITIVPLTVFFDNETFLDNVELDSDSFYAKLQASKVMPRTSQPAPAAFQEAFSRLIEEGADGILAILLSSGLSGTYQSALTARDTLPEELQGVPIEIIDSQSISAGIALAARNAVREAQAGKSLAEIKAHTLDQLERTRIIAILDTLEFVRRGGRIGAARAFLGNMLSVKPMVSLKDGAVVPLEQPRTRSKAFARAAQFVSEEKPLEAIVVAESSAEIGQQLVEALHSVYEGEIPRYKLGSVLGTHTGPGTVAVVTVSAPHSKPD